MHSSRMRTGRSLTVCQSLLPGGMSVLGGLLLGGGCLIPDVSVLGGESAPGGRWCLFWWVPAPGGCLLPWGVYSWGGCLLPGRCLLQGGSAPGGCLLRGVLLPGRCLIQGECLLWGVSAPRGVYSWGVSVPRGSLLPGGCLLPGGGGIPACTEAHTPLWTESQMPVKILLWPNFVAAGNNLK